jgi:hypothetical protein
MAARTHKSKELFSFETPLQILHSWEQIVSKILEPNSVYLIHTKWLDMTN